MAELRGGEISDDKDVQFTASCETIDVLGAGGKHAEEVNKSGVDVLMEEESGGEVRDEKNLNFGDGGETIDADKEVQKQAGIGIFDGAISDGFSGNRIFEEVVLQSKISFNENLETNDDVETLDFGRDTNRLDYFRVAPFDVFGDENHRGNAIYGGGGGGGVDRTLQIPAEISYTNGSVAGDEVSPRSGDLTRQTAVGISSNNNGRSSGYGGGSGGGEMIIQNFEHERAIVGGGNGIRIRRRIRAPRVPNRRDGLGWSTKRIRYFRTIPFDVHGNDDLHGIVNEGGGDRSPQIPVEVYSNGNVAGDGGRRNLGIELSLRSGDMAQQLISSNDVNGGGGEEEGGVGLWEKWWFWGVGWWEKWWLLLALWKTV